MSDSKRYEQESLPLLDNSNGFKRIEDDTIPNSSWLCCVPSNFIFSGELSQPTNSMMSTIFLLLNSMIGSGILAQAHVFSQAGIIVTFIEYGAVGLMTYLGVHLLIKSGERLDIFEFGAIAISVLGQRGQLLVDICIVLGNLGALLSYIIIIGSLTQSIFFTFVAEVDDIPWYLTIPFLSALIVGFMVSPLCLIRRFGHLAIVSYISMLAICGTVLLVAIGGPLESKNNSEDSLNMASFSGSVHTIGSVVFAFGYLSAVFHAYIAMKPRSIESFSHAAQITTLLGISLCSLIGLTGYLSFRTSTDTDILENFTGPVGAVFKLAVIIHLIFYIPGDFLIMRFSFFQLFGVSVDELSDSLYISFTLTMLGIVTTAACVIQTFASTNQSLSTILDLTGGISGSIINFILPGVIALIVFKDERKEFYQAVILAIFGSCVTLLVLATAFV